MTSRAFFLICCLLAASVGLKAQALWSNAGVLVSIKDSAMLSIQGDAINRFSGITDNTDTIYITGNWTNSAGNAAFAPTGTGWFNMIGDDQYINGEDVTHFHNLTLDSTGIKYGELDVVVQGTLNLTDREFNLDTNTVFVWNNDTGAVRWREGFVSSWVDGGLSRNTNSTDEYIFPVGNSDMGTMVRPVVLKPTEAFLNTYKVRYAAVDASDEGFNREIGDYLICYSNDDYYHRIYHTAGMADASIGIWYDDILDGTYNGIAQWHGTPGWQKTKPAVAGTPLLAYADLTIEDWASYDYIPYILTYETDAFAVGSGDTIRYRGDSVRLSIYSGTVYNWTPDYGLSCDDCQDPLAWPDTSTTYIIEIMTQEGCTDYDTIYVDVRDKTLGELPLEIPTGITPNGDGVNDTWVIDNLDQFPDNSVVVVNRWGDEIFRMEPYDNSWDGTFQGKELPEATYYFILQVNSGFDTGQYDGPITIIR